MVSRKFRQGETQAVRFQSPWYYHTAMPFWGIQAEAKELRVWTCTAWYRDPFCLRQEVGLDDFQPPTLPRAWPFQVEHLHSSCLLSHQLILKWRKWCVCCVCVSMCWYGKWELQGIRLCDFGGRQVPRSAVSKLETQQTWWYSSRLKASKLKTQEELMFQFKSKGKEKNDAPAQRQSSRKNSLLTVKNQPFVLFRPLVD